MRFGTYFFLQAPPGRTGAEILPEEVDQMVLAEELDTSLVFTTDRSDFSVYRLKDRKAFRILPD